MAEDHSPRRPAGIAGPVLLIGGAEDRRRDRVILTRFVDMAGGPDARIAVISTASSLGDMAHARYADLFQDLGAAEVVGLRPVTREEANHPDAWTPLAESTGVYVTGGNQMRLMSVVSGTKLEDALASAHDRGAVVAGTSAGASALAAHMVAFGRPGPSPKHRMVHLAAGLGLVPDVVVDQHFEQRGRWGRLLAAVAIAPKLIGLGLDEDTAAIVYGDRTLEVVGKGSVTLVDGSEIVTDAYHATGHRPMLVSGAKIHALPSGSWFDLRARGLLTVDEVEEREASE